MLANTKSRGLYDESALFFDPGVRLVSLGEQHGELERENSSSSRHKVFCIHGFFTRTLRILQICVVICRSLQRPVAVPGVYVRPSASGVLPHDGREQSANHVLIFSVELRLANS